MLSFHEKMTKYSWYYWIIRQFTLVEWCILLISLEILAYMLII